MGFFNRVFKIGQSEAHSALDKLEDPVKMTDQGIRDMKEQLDASIRALAEVKAMAIRAKNESNTYRNKVQEYESKAIAILQRASNGGLDATEADRLASLALQKKEECTESLKVALQNQKTYEAQVEKLESNVQKLKSTISKWENEAKTLKARAKVSAATVSVNKQLANIDSSSTVAMLEKMKEKVETQEALSESYMEIADQNKSVDDELDSVLQSTGGASDALAALKAKMSSSSEIKAIE